MRGKNLVMEDENDEREDSVWLQEKEDFMVSCSKTGRVVCSIKFRLLRQKKRQLPMGKSLPR